jgi:hypothetical protein
MVADSMAVVVEPVVEVGVAVPLVLVPLGQRVLLVAARVAARVAVPASED